MSSSPLLEQLIDALRVLPGVGPKSAQRMAYHLLARERAGGSRLGDALTRSMDSIGNCKHCRDFTEDEICPICASDARDDSQICVVESPSDRLAIESATDYRGRYFVLHGKLSPLDGIGPSDIGLDVLRDRLAALRPSEVIIATNSTIEGEATAHFISDLAQSMSIGATRLAHGVPLGGELEYIDRGTLSHAFGMRTRTDG